MTMANSNVDSQESFDIASMFGEEVVVVPPPDDDEEASPPQPVVPSSSEGGKEGSSGKTNVVLITRATCLVEIRGSGGNRLCGVVNCDKENHKKGPHAKIEGEFPRLGIKNVKRHDGIQVYCSPTMAV